MLRAPKQLARNYAVGMCAGYGLELRGPNSDRGERVGLRGPIPPGDTPEGRALLEAWVAERGGRARITGSKARNLNPLIRAGDGERELALAWWWLHVGGAPAKFTAFNARSDRLLSSWHGPFQHRALLPASWYVEKGVRFALPGGEEFGMAAVTAPVAASDTGAAGDTGLDSYALVTRAALGGAAEIHDRMPLVLPRELHDEWLDPERAGDAELVRKVVSVSEEISRELLGIGPDAAEGTTGSGGSAGSGGSRGSGGSQAAEHPRLF